MTAAEYRYLLVQASTGQNLGEIPLRVTEPFTRQLNGVGQLSGTLPLNHPLVTTANFDTQSEVTVLRNGVPVWNGPVTYANPSLDAPTFDLTAREATWYLSRRTLEVDKNWNADLYYIVRQLISYATTKKSTTGDGMGTAGQDINAAIPRLTVSPASGNSGYTRSVRYSGNARHLLLDILADLVADPVSPLDYRMDVTTGSTYVTAQRTFTLGAPLGVQRNQQITENVVSRFDKTIDRERAANRVHTLGNGYTYTLQNKTSVTTNADILLESVFDHSETANQDDVQAFTRAARRATIPPVTDYTISYRPGLGPLDFRWCDLGDGIYMNTSTSLGILHTVGWRRVLVESIMPPIGDQPETVTLGVNVWVDQLGT